VPVPAEASVRYAISNFPAAVDRGFRCITTRDARGSSYPALHDAVMAMAGVEGGIFGMVTTSAEMVRAIAVSARIAASALTRGPLSLWQGIAGLMFKNSRSDPLHRDAHRLAYLWVGIVARATQCNQCHEIIARTECVCRLVANAGHVV